MGSSNGRVARYAAVAVPLVLALGFASGRSVEAGAANPWYAGLAKPAGTPPDWAFPVAWSLIYVCLGLAVALVLGGARGRARAGGVLAFASTVALAAAWMPVFFGMHRVDAALGVALSMLAAGSLTAVLFRRAGSAAAARLMLPFLLWTGYAAGLTWGIARANPDGRGGAHGLAPGARATQVPFRSPSR